MAGKKDYPFDSYDSKEELYDWAKTANYGSPSRDFVLFNGDTFELLPQFSFKFDMIFADPPYFLSNGGISVQSGKVVCVDKGEWDKAKTPEEIMAFNREWLSLCRDKLKENGTIWISGTYHNIFSIANCLTELGYKILNVVTWQKTNPPQNISCRFFTYSTEFIIWARKSKKTAHYFNYELMKRINDNKQMTDVWRLPAIGRWEKTCGKHPTQKPLGLLSRIILASTKPGAWILDPFAGSSTTGIAANLLGRRFLGIEQDEKFAKISQARREEIEDIKVFLKFRSKIPDIVKAENNQPDLFTCNEPIIEQLPFLDNTTLDAKDDILMFAAAPRSRKGIEAVGKLAIGIKNGELDDININNVGYIMFHYWKNENATPYRIKNNPLIVNKQDIPDGYLLRLATGAKSFLLLEFDPSKSADIGSYDIMKVQRKGKGRYLPFSASLQDIKI